MARYVRPKTSHSRQWILENALATLGHRLFWDDKLSPEKRRRLDAAHERLARELYGLDD